MPKPITARFYRVGKVHQNGASLRTALQAIFDMGEPGDREFQLDGALRCRLERFTANPGYLAGEMMRVRSTDLPCEVHPDGTRILGLDVPIGDGVAFLYREADHTLAIQYDNQTLAPGRFNSYVGQLHQAGQYTFEPAVDPEALARFRAQPLRKLKIRLARPSALAPLEDEMAPAGQAFHDLGEYYEAPELTLELSMGRNKGQLGAAAKQLVEGILRIAGDSADVRALKVTPEAGEGVPNEDINLLDTLLSDKGEIAPASDAPDDVYAAAADFLRIRLAQHG